MRNRRSSKQCLWLGSGLYFRCRRRRNTDADAHCYADGDTDGNSNSQRYGDSDATTDPISKVGAYATAAPYASAEALDFSAPEFRNRLQP
jgi:hypothetical protein